MVSQVFFCCAIDLCIISLFISPAIYKTMIKNEKRCCSLRLIFSFHHMIKR
jgi:hypothetical protein